MRELDRIRLALIAARERGESAVLVTVMGVDGSVYRGAGARMVVTSRGETVGAVSGGCLEADIVARAPDVLAAGRAEMVQYDTRASDDVVLGLGLGCQGVIDLLLEPLTGAALDESIAFHERLATRRAPVTLATLVRSSPGLTVGARVVIAEDGTVLEGEPLLLARESDVARETVRPATPLVVCGAGNDAIPVVRLAKQMGWHVSVVDHRPSFVSAARFPEADALVCANLSAERYALGGQVTLDERTMALVMAHAATHDRAYLHTMLDANAAYIGVLGPRRRTMELLGERAVDGVPPANVHSPVGLDLGAETSEEIALAIVAEVAAVAARRSGGMLKDRPGPIHDRSQVAQAR